MDKNHNNARNEGESFEEYKVRRRTSNQAIRWYMQSRFPEQKQWDSSLRGTFKKSEHPA